VTAALGLLLADRQSVIIVAFWVLVAAGVVVSVGAWILLRREPRAGKPPKDEPKGEPQSPPEGTDGDAGAEADQETVGKGSPPA
jgi:hypothetical protein